MNDGRGSLYVLDYEVRHCGNGPRILVSDRVRAQGYGVDETMPDFVTFWRYIETGRRQQVASFLFENVLSVAEDSADSERITVPDEWSSTERASDGSV